MVPAHGTGLVGWAQEALASSELCETAVGWRVQEIRTARLLLGTSLSLGSRSRCHVAATLCQPL